MYTIIVRAENRIYERHFDINFQNISVTLEEIVAVDGKVSGTSIATFFFARAIDITIAMHSINGFMMSFTTLTNLLRTKEGFVSWIPTYRKVY